MASLPKQLTLNFAHYWTHLGGFIGHGQHWNLQHRHSNKLESFLPRTCSGKKCFGVKKTCSLPRCTRNPIPFKVAATKWRPMASAVAPNELHFVEAEPEPNPPEILLQTQGPKPLTQTSASTRLADATRAVLFTVKRNLTEFQFQLPGIEINLAYIYIFFFFLFNYQLN